MSNQLYIEFVLRGITYKYPVAQYSSNNNKGPYGYVRDKYNQDNAKQFTEYKNFPLVSLFEFLDLPKTVTSFSGTINGITATFSIDNYEPYSLQSFSGTTPPYYVDITINNKTTRFYEKYTDKWYYGNTDLFGAGIGFNNHRDYKKFVIVACGAFRPYPPIIADSRPIYTKDYTPYLENTFQAQPSWDESSYNEGELYAGSYYKEGGAIPLGYRTGSFASSSWTDELTKTVTPIYYPDNGEPDDEPDDPLPTIGDDESDPIPDPPTPPTWDVTNTGFVVMYNPTVQEIRELAYFMWSGDFTDLIKKMFASPFEALISLKMVYCPVVTGAAKLTVWLGNVETTVSMSKVVEQFADVDMGTINITEYFGSFADYAPYTKIQIYLPFIGYKDLNVDEVMNAALHLRYRVDVYTGSCIAYLTVTKNIKGTALNSILYQFDGNCACEIPFTSNDNSRYVSALLTTAASTALSMAATSGVSAAEPALMMDKGTDAKLNIGSLAPVANGMLDVLSTKPNIQRAGSLTGSVAAMCVKKPYVIIRRPIAQMPKDYQHYLGIPLNLSMQLSSVTGYTIVSQIFLSSATATDKEIEEITQLLKSGVIL